MSDHARRENTRNGGDDGGHDGGRGGGGDRLAQERNHLAAERTELAARRTDRAIGRTSLAAERTFSAWLRTGITAEVTGLGIARFLGELGPRGLVLATSVLFVLAAMGAYLTALLGYRQRQTRLKDSEMQAPRRSYWFTQILVLLLLLSAVAASVLVFLQ